MNISDCKLLPCAQTVSLPCCKSDTETNSTLKNVDVICRIAIGVFGMIIAPFSFLVSFGVGFIGSALDVTLRYKQNKPMYPNGASKPVCAQGYMDFLSGMRFPPVAATLATTAFIAAHLRHDPKFYAPFCGLFLGVWTGREAVFLSHALAGRISCCKASP